VLCQLSLRTFSDSLRSCRPSSFRSFTPFASGSGRAPCCTWKSSRSDISSSWSIVPAVHGFASSLLIVCWRPGCRSDCAASARHSMSCSQRPCLAAARLSPGRFTYRSRQTTVVPRHLPFKQCAARPSDSHRSSTCKVKIEAWRVDYNQRRLRSLLGHLTSASFGVRHVESRPLPLSRTSQRVTATRTPTGREEIATSIRATLGVRRQFDERQTWSH